MPVYHENYDNVTCPLYPEIHLPHKQYYLDIKDPDICRLDVTSSLATAKVMGSTEVVLKDRNVVVTEFFRQPSAMLHVVAPGFLGVNQGILCYCFTLI